MLLLKNDNRVPWDEQNLLYLVLNTIVNFSDVELREMIMKKFLYNACRKLNQTWCSKTCNR